MNLDRHLRDCSELRAAGAGRVWLCRLLRPTLGKKFFVLFAVLAATLLANWLAVEATLSHRQGMAALINVTGSLRWLSQRIQLDTARIERGFSHDRSPVDAHLARLDEAIRALEDGGRAQGIAIGGLPDSLRMDIAAVRLYGDNLRRHARQALAGMAQGLDVGEHQTAMYLEGGNLLGSADAIAAALTREAQEAEARLMDILLWLGLLDLTILIVLLLAIRLRIITPLRKLAAVSRGFAKGRHDLRSGFRSLDEVGQLAFAFDSMADTIESDIQRLAAGAAALRQSQVELEKFAIAIAQAPVSVLITDAAGTIEYVNPRFSELSGYAAAEVLGRNPRMLASEQTPRAVYEAMWRQLRAGCAWHGELLNRKKSGELFWEETHIAPLMDERGHVTHFVAVKEDITWRKRAEAEIAAHSTELERRVAERTRQLAESNRELEAFSYSVSHDLRAPLRGINGFASLMAENCKGCGKTESLEYMARIRNASARMGNLIDDLLDLSRLAHRAIKAEQVDLSAMAHSVLDDLVVAGPARRVQAEVQEDMLAQGDATLLRDMLENLLGNAWKFTAQRDPAHIGFGCIEENGERVYYVRDNGAGFDMKYAGKLFGAFQRLHGPQEFEGNGIGLAMVRRIVALHGGRVWAEGTPGLGATFYFTLGGQVPAAGPPQAT